MNRLLCRLAGALAARETRDALRLCTQLEQTYGVLGSKTALENPDAGVCIRVLNALAAQCKGGTTPGAARPHAASRSVEARVAIFFGTIAENVMRNADLGRSCGPRAGCSAGAGARPRQRPGHHRAVHGPADGHVRHRVCRRQTAGRRLRRGGAWRAARAHPVLCGPAGGGWRGAGEPGRAGSPCGAHLAVKGV